jgi:hypothetical protein
LYRFIKLNENILAMPVAMEEDLHLLQSALYIRKAGVQVGTIIRDELIPDHELAISNIQLKEDTHQIKVIEIVVGLSQKIHYSTLSRAKRLGAIRIPGITAWMDKNAR